MNKNISKQCSLTDNDELRKLLFSKFGFTEDGSIHVKNQVKIFEILKWIREMNRESKYYTMEKTSCKPILNKTNLLVWLKALRDSAYSENDSNSTGALKEWYDTLISDIDNLFD